MSLKPDQPETVREKGEVSQEELFISLVSAHNTAFLLALIGLNIKRLFCLYGFYLFICCCFLGVHHFLFCNSQSKNNAFIFIYEATHITALHDMGKSNVLHSI